MVAPIWTTAGFPVDNDGHEDAAARQVGTTLAGGTILRVVEFSPGVQARNHRTDLIDYAIIMSGEIDMEMDGTAIHLKAAGALVDAVRWKRTLIAAGAVAVAAAAVAMALAPSFWPVAVAQGVSGAADAVFPSAVAAISLGIVGRRSFTRRAGRNEAFNHAGNVVTALAAGAAGYLVAPSAVLWIVAGLALASLLAAYAVKAGTIDHAVARGADDGDHGKSETSGLKVLLGNRPLLLFTIAITLFHFANAAMLPLVGETLAQGNQHTGSLFMASCIIAAQLVMVPMAVLVGRKADDWGRKPLFLAGFAVLPIRGVLYTVTQHPDALVAIQLLDGVGAGIFGVLFFVVVADLRAYRPLQPRPRRLGRMLGPRRGAEQRRRRLHRRCLGLFRRVSVPGGGGARSARRILAGRAGNPRSPDSDERRDGTPPGWHGRGAGLTPAPGSRTRSRASSPGRAPPDRQRIALRPGARRTIAATAKLAIVAITVATTTRSRLGSGQRWSSCVIRISTGGWRT